MFARSGNWRPKPIIAKTRAAKDVGKRKHWQRWIRRIPCLIKRSARSNNCMTNNMAKAKGTISGTTQHNMTAKTWSIVLKHHDIVGKQKSKDKGGKDWSAKRVGKQQQVTALNLTHNQKRLKHAQRQPKQKYEGQHGTEKGTNLRRTSLKTTKLKQNDDRKAWGDISNCHDGVGLEFKETRQQRWHGRSEVIKNAKPDSRSGTAWVAVAKTKDPTITLVNCTGERRRGQGSDNQSAELHRCRRRDQGSIQLFIGMFHILLLMGMRHTPVCNIIEWLHVYACMCMIVCVWLYDKVRMMSWWRL